jgi:cytoskeletal protein RodZ
MFLKKKNNLTHISVDYKSNITLIMVYTHIIVMYNVYIMAILNFIVLVGTSLIVLQLMQINVGLF